MINSTAPAPTHKISSVRGDNSLLCKQHLNLLVVSSIVWFICTVQYKNANKQNNFYLFMYRENRRGERSKPQARCKPTKQDWKHICTRGQKGAYSKKKEKNVHRFNQRMKYSFKN
jgi:hypothetical protein